ncbi:MAG: sigma 54 modulation/S30EA ribosomal C-terminal domain-containing protein [Ilumatobacteraceae bacterium]
MPDGVVEWYDANAGEGRIVRRGHRYTVLEGELDPHGRHPGARVHFDVDRSRGDVAVNVTSIPGRGSGRHRRRTGNLSGRRSPDQPVGPSSAAEPPLLAAGLGHRPLQLGELWAALVAAGDIENLTRLYAPHAVVRDAGVATVGPAAIGRFWERSELLGRRPESVAMTADGRISVRWAPSTETVFTVSSAGDVTDLEWNTAVDEIGAVLDRTDADILHATIRLERVGDPARERGAIASAMVDLDGVPVRARGEAADMDEAIHRLAARLRDRLRHLADRRLAVRHRGAEHVPGEWRHGDRPTERARFFERPVDEREIVRRTTFAPAEATVEEAIFDLESLDHEFHLFTDLATGHDAVVRRGEDGGFVVDDHDACASQGETRPITP